MRLEGFGSQCPPDGCFALSLGQDAFGYQTSGKGSHRKVETSQLETVVWRMGGELVEDFHLPATITLAPNSAVLTVPDAQEGHG